MRRTWQGIAAAAAVVMGAAGVAPAVAVGGSARRANVQFRTVLATLPPSTGSATTPLTNDGGVVESCDAAAVAADEFVTTTVRNHADECVVLEQGSPGEGARLYLGPVAFDGDGVRRAASLSNAGQHVVELELTTAGKRALNRLAADGFPRPSPMNQIAFVVDGVVVAAPAFQEPSFMGDILFSGAFTAAEAKEMARRITDSRWLSRYCTSATSEVPESYVGSARHIAALRNLEEGAPHEVEPDLARVRRFIERNVDPADPDSQIAARWPSRVRTARNNLTAYTLAHCH